MSERTIYLVYGWDDYEMPCRPVKAFDSQQEAEAFRDRCREYHESRPECPVDTMQELTDEQEAEFNRWASEVDRPWGKNHPAGECNEHRDGFDVMPIPMVTP